MTAAALTAAPVEPQSEFGATVADAERLLRRAKYCYVFVRVGMHIGETELISVPKSAIKAELKRRNGSKPFPCELYPHAIGDGGFDMMIGHSTAIEKATEARR